MTGLITAQAVLGDPTFIVLALAGLLAGLAFIRFEQIGRPQRTAALVLVVVVVEMLLYPSQNDVGAGIFRPYLFGQSFRLPELLILVALVARLVVRGLPARLTFMGAAWGVFLLWWSVALVTGLLHGNGFDLALYHFKAVIYVGGGMVLTAGVSAERFVERRSLRRWATVLGLVLLACIVPTVTGEPLELDSVLAGGALFGLVAADAATALAGIGVVLLFVEGARRQRPQLVVALAAVLMLVFTFLQGQRGAIIGLATAMALAAALSFTSTWKRRIATSRVEVALFVALALVPVTVSVMWSAANPSRPASTPAVTVPLAEDLDRAFTSTGKRQSAQTRQNLWRDGFHRFDQRPIFGSGLGTEYSVEQSGIDENLVGGGFHNVILDVMVRTGWVGAALFLIAVAATIRSAADSWRRHPDPRVAALVMGVMVALANVAAKGMVESVFEKYRLATLTGLLLGVVVSVAASMPRNNDGSEVRTWDDIDERQLEPTTS